MFNIAIVDDDKSSADLIIKFIRRYGGEEQETFNIEFYDNGILFLENYKMTLDLVIINIEMPDFDGIDTARQLREKDENVCLIFLAFTSEHALCGYDVDAMDFILKPVDYSLFALKLKKALKHIRKSRQESFLIKYEGELIRIPYQELRYIEIQNHWLIYHLAGSEFKVRGALSKIKDRFVGRGFAQCNNCYLVNLDYIDKVSGNIIVVGKDILQISHARKKAFLSTLNDYMQNDATG